MRRRSPRFGEKKMRTTTRKWGALLLATHASPYVPTVDVHVKQVEASRGFDGDPDTELNSDQPFSSLSPAVRVSPAILSLPCWESGGISASPQVRVVHVSAAAPAADVEFWDGAIVTPVSDDSDLPFGDAFHSS